ncbi:MAG TPA: PA domain-containing protein [Rubrobacteraceae bacterium]|nr:PA domain-containing protein [Rubrobacteraceae bacterium]
MVRRFWLLGALLLALSALVGGAAFAHDDFTSDGGIREGSVERHLYQHGGDAGHLPSSAKNVDLISKLQLKNVEPEKIADVGVSPSGDYAFLAAWGGATCKYNGVHVVDIANPAQPKEVSFIQSKEGSYPGEGVQALNLTTSAFNGDILVTNNEICKDKAGFGGMNIYNVTDPRHPTPLVEGIGDSTVNGQGKKGANEIHSVYAWDAGTKAYAVIVDNEEAMDVDILDITNPKNAKLIAEYDLAQKFPQILQSAPENLTEVFLHDMVVKKIGTRQVMLASYWDGGYVKLDVTDPLAPTYLGDTDFTNPDPEAAESGLTVPPEGNGHEAEFTLDNRFVVGADEDFAPFALVARNVDDNTVIHASQGSNTRKLEEGQTITGTSVFAGRACPGDPAVPAGDPNATDVAVVERGVCTFTEKVQSVLAAGGYDAVLIFNRVGSDACETPLSMSVEGDIPTFGVAPRSQGYAIFDIEGSYDEAACLAAPAGSQLAPIAVGAKGDTLTFSSYFDGWGYVHLFGNTGGKMAELDTYAIPEAHDPAYANGFGDLSVHEVATSKVNASRMYFSYYSGGFRVARITADQKIAEVGHYIAPGGNNLWGVEVFQDAGQEYVAASDRDSGLFIFKYTGP